MKLLGSNKENKICADCAFKGTKSDILTGAPRDVCTKITKTQQDLVTGRTLTWNTECEVMRLKDCGRKGRYWMPKDTPKENLRTLVQERTEFRW